MAIPAEKARYSFADCLTWDENVRAEIIDGEVYLMAPPSRAHQKGKTSEVYPAPFGVRLFEKDGDCPEEVSTVVEPDISVVCDRDKLDEYGCRGAPDLVMEILSPSSRRHDRLVKLGLYQRAGVREYWIVNPEEKTVQVLLLENGNLRPHEEYGQDSVAMVNVLSGCFIELSKVFAE